MSFHHDHHAPERPCCGLSTNLEDYFLTRRQFLGRMGMGVGALSLATLLDPGDLAAAQSRTASKPVPG
ncbi:MAG: twin-arginine translocation signal domain-containing protein, partial [Verrucomicrobia bacterium]|nr:twin-arginine translocation signal domain-containing protein [Verrucomicrobiota bacterium]